MIQKLKYNYFINQKLAYVPAIATVIGALRVTSHIASLSFDIFCLLREKNQREQISHKARIYLDIKQITRGGFELIPFFGSFGVYAFNKFASPAEKLAYKVQKLNKLCLTKSERLKFCPSLRALREKDFLDHKEFCEFINGEWDNVLISTDESKISDFLNAFEACNWKSSILTEDEMLPFYAMTAFSRKQIDVNDMATILHIYTAKLIYNEIEIVEDPKIDDIELNGFLKHDYQLNAIFDSAKKAIPMKKRVAFSCKSLINGLEIDKISLMNRVELLKLGTGYGTLYAQALAISGIHQGKKGKDYHLSFDLEEEISRRLFKHKSISFFPKLGVLSPLDIKRGVLNYDEPCRFVALYFPFCRSPKKVHDSIELPTVITRHDIIHAHITRFYPPRAVEKIKELIKIFEKLIGNSMSKEIWLLTDMIAEQFLSKSKLREESAFFMNFFQDEGLADGGIAMKDLVFENGQLTLFGIFLLVQFSEESYRGFDTNWLLDRKENKVLMSILEKYQTLSLKEKVFLLNWIQANLVKKKFNLEKAQNINIEGMFCFERILEGPRKNCYRINKYSA
jgi:hypothetical protein